jgi:hypothetical protein
MPRGRVIEDLAGQRFGHLTAVEFLWRTKRRQTVWRCVCDCGKGFAANAIDLKQGIKSNCGCVRPKRIGHKPNMLGMRFGRLVVVEDAGVNYRHLAMWRCKCDCGGEKVTSGSNLRLGTASSCNCLRKERAKAAVTTHGDTRRDRPRAREYHIYTNIISRCYNPDNIGYKHYGGRGITVSPEWLGPGGYENFLRHMGRKQPGKGSVERLNNELGYGPDNCVWADRITQANNKRSNRRIVFMGEEMTFAQASRKSDVSYATAFNRVKRGWSIDRAFTELPHD